MRRSRGFERFPAWMWRNTDVLASSNGCAPTTMPPGGRARGLLRHGPLQPARLHRRRAGVPRRVDPEAARARASGTPASTISARSRAYGYAAAFGAEPICEERGRRAARRAARTPPGTRRDDAATSFPRRAERALVVERGALLPHDVPRRVAWNLRDTHMADTLDAIASTWGAGGRAKIVVWAHNSHLGDGRATEMGAPASSNVGQLMRERHGNDTVLVGFTTSRRHRHRGAAWGDRRAHGGDPSVRGSNEALLHESRCPALVPSWTKTRPSCRHARRERAIGVVYRRDTERGEPLVPRAPGGAIRRGPALRRDERGRAARAARAAARVMSRAVARACLDIHRSCSACSSRYRRCCSRSRRRRLRRRSGRCPRSVQQQLKDGGFWHRGCPVALSNLRLLTVTHRDFRGRDQTGQLIVNKTAAPALERVFRKLLQAALPDPPPAPGRRLRARARAPARRRRQRLVRVPPGGAVALPGRRRHAVVVQPRLRPRRRSQPGREPVRRLRPDSRPEDAGPTAIARATGAAWSPGG